MPLCQEIALIYLKKKKIKYKFIKIKTWSNIEKSRKKEQIKLALTQKMEDEKRQKQELREKKEKEIDEKKEENSKRKEEIKNSFVVKKDNKLNQLRQEAMMLKEQKNV